MRLASQQRARWVLPSLATLRANAGWFALTLIAVVGIVQASWLLAQGLYRDHSWKVEARATRARVAALEHKVADASERASSAASDPAYLEALARRLGYVREGERVIVPLPSGEAGR